MYWRKKKIFILISLLLICVCLFSGYYLKITIQKANSYSMSTKAFLYLQKALNIMEKKFIYKDTIDWDSIKKEVYKKAEGSVLTSDTYPAIQLARSLIKENHGFFASPSQMELLEKEEFRFEPPIYRLLEKNVAYLSLFTFPSTSDEADQAYNKQVQTAIRALDSSNVDKWIIDLRKNQGGNMWAMLLGLGPLLDKECIGFFIRNNGEKIPWKHKKNTVKQGNSCCLKSSLPPYQLKNTPKIAVLIGNNTASSGEAVAVAFSGQKNVRFFGQHTSGFANATYPFFLSDGACLLLPVMHFSNRLGQIFYTNMAPDEVINANEATNSLKDPTIEAAIDWLCNF
ncbi:Peptidase family S41 [Candidatus Rhabdochlamydia sp. T3358]|jgi:hypothetical protein|nr:Peptidase family S41 [Candidatus Rhabdochlamydia sp. T3358]